MTTPETTYPTHLLLISTEQIFKHRENLSSNAYHVNMEDNSKSTSIQAVG